uniref:HSF-type DNA-binding domain-containing protein n=1 Tax=Mastacembelus armatus TaxID=205130 RepID=A0A3Q3L5D3_9TELE
MDAGESSLPDTINPNNFPAKLWRLVNNPDNRAISWDSLGEVIIIDQKLFECHILNPSTTASDNADIFKTTNFSSFVRQLNLYGFRKVDPAAKAIHHYIWDSGRYHYFYNPNFKRNHPELVASLRRLTVDNKAKIQAGLNVNCRPPSRYQRFCLDVDGKDKNVKRGKCHCITHHGCGQASLNRYPVNMFCHGDYNHDLQTKENQEEKKCDVNLDAIFKIADEVMQTPNNNCLVKAVTPEKTGPVLEVPFNTNNAMLCNTPGSTIKANPSGSFDVVTQKQQEEYVVSVPEQMPEDAIFEVSFYSVDFLKVFSFIICKDKELHQNEREKRKCNSLAEDLYIVCCCFLCALVRLPVKKQRTLRS